MESTSWLMRREYWKDPALLIGGYSSEDEDEDNHDANDQSIRSRMGAFRDDWQPQLPTTHTANTTNATLSTNACASAPASVFSALASASKVTSVSAVSGALDVESCTTRRELCKSAHPTSFLLSIPSTDFSAPDPPPSRPSVRPWIFTPSKSPPVNSHQSADTKSNSSEMNSSSSFLTLPPLWKRFSSWLTNPSQAVPTPNANIPNTAISTPPSCPTFVAFSCPLVSPSGSLCNDSNFHILSLSLSLIIFFQILSLFLSSQKLYEFVILFIFLNFYLIEVFTSPTRRMLSLLSSAPTIDEVINRITLANPIITYSATCWHLTRDQYRVNTFTQTETLQYKKCKDGSDFLHLAQAYPKRTNPTTMTANNHPPTTTTATTHTTSYPPIIAARASASSTCSVARVSSKYRRRGLDSHQHQFLVPLVSHLESSPPLPSSKNRPSTDCSLRSRSCVGIVILRVNLTYHLLDLDTEERARDLREKLHDSCRWRDGYYDEQEFVSLPGMPQLDDRTFAPIICKVIAKRTTYSPTNVNTNSTTNMTTHHVSIGAATTSTTIGVAATSASGSSGDNSTGRVEKRNECKFLIRNLASWLCVMFSKFKQESCFSYEWLSLPTYFIFSLFLLTWPYRILVDTYVVNKVWNVRKLVSIHGDQTAEEEFGWNTNTTTATNANADAGSATTNTTALTDGGGGGSAATATAIANSYAGNISAPPTIANSATTSMATEAVAASATSLASAVATRGGLSVGLGVDDCGMVLSDSSPSQ